MTELAWLLGGALLGGGLAWVLGIRKGAGAVRRQIGGISRSLQASGSRRMPGPESDEVPEARELRAFLEREWAPLEEFRDRAVRSSLARMAAFLRHRVEAPLLGGLDGDEETLRAEAEGVLEAVEDLEFFLEAEPSPEALEERNLLDVVQEVTREFGAQSPVLVKVVAPSAPLRVRVDPELLKDALFLLLHNAGEFGLGGPVQVILSRRADRACLQVRDKGPGFSDQALQEAMNPFYSTSPAGLGLGLPYARRAVACFDGELNLRNAEGGGADVEVVLPLAG